MNTLKHKELIMKAADNFALDFDRKAFSLRLDSILFGELELPPSKPEIKTKFSLTESQKSAFEIAKNQSVLITGEAGTGKSFLLGALIDYFDKAGRNVSVTATTGTAAVNISGSTIFSWAGIGIGDKDGENLIRSVRKQKKAVDRIRNCQVLIVDEVSMLKGEICDKLNMVFQSIRGDRRPFGGIQCIWVGDFCQIPVIPRAGRYDFCFTSDSWKIQNPSTLKLKEIVRQDNKEFVSFLSDLRVGKITNFALLESRFNAKLDGGNVKPINIFCRNVDVDADNKRELNKLTGKIHNFTALDTGESRHIETLDKNCLAQRSLDLKVGAQVMLLKNIDVENGLCNGSLGIVTKIDKEPTVSFNGVDVLIGPEDWEITEQEVTVTGKFKKRVLAKRKQIPLKLAYAATVHKTQGQTLDKARIDLTGAWEFGSHYVAISRVRRLEDLSLVPFDTTKIKCHPDCLAFYLNNEETKTEEYDF